MKLDIGMLLVTGCAVLTLSGASLLCCPTAHAGSPARAASAAFAASAAPASPAQAPQAGEDTLDDDRAEHWAVPEIAREGQVQCVALGAALLAAGAFGMRRRSILKGQRHG